MQNALTMRSRPAEARLTAHLAWYASGLVIAFLVPFVFTTVLDIHHDLYYLVYFSVALAFLAMYALWTPADVLGLFTRNWRWSVVLGVVAAAFLVFGVLNREDATPRPDGLYFVFSIFWRGLAYGVVDALVLTAFPLAVAYSILDERLDSLIRRGVFAILTLALVVVITAVYHLGYEQFRDDGVAGPETGNLIISVPAILTANPIGSVVAHSAMHITADIHAYETDLYLPPQTDAD